ncbi:hypothetical protein [Psittacicella hinzii]|uniref:Uncharacterized protein n=1 Tax=Psittacicella hinzii TaxID=2028575 RepID=A0A3A1YRC4_9GAMM|nr:hypothetical protein [Psittacicella hinzii]RIY39490.1 hypothetical protein CKF58_02175 [Psittacicella hinzii]
MTTETELEAQPEVDFELRRQQTLIEFYQTAHDSLADRVRELVKEYQASKPEKVAFLLNLFAVYDQTTKSLTDRLSNGNVHSMSEEGSSLEFTGVEGLQRAYETAYSNLAKQMDVVSGKQAMLNRGRFISITKTRYFR